MEKTALLIIDMQHDFVCKDGALCVRMAESTVAYIRKLLDYARESGWNIYHIIRQHDAAGRNADRYRKHLFTNGGKGYCVTGSYGAKIIEPLTPYPDENIIIKTRNSAFFHTDLEKMLRSDKIERVIISGTQYPNCIRATANDAMSLDYHTVIATDCCSAQSEEIASSNIRDMSNMGIECISLDEILKC